MDRARLRYLRRAVNAWHKRGNRGAKQLDPYLVAEKVRRQVRRQFALRLGFWMLALYAIVVIAAALWQLEASLLECPSVLFGLRQMGVPVRVALWIYDSYPPFVLGLLKICGTALLAAAGWWCYLQAVKVERKYRE